MTTRPIRQLAGQRRIMRALGVVAFALFTVQTTALAWTRCDIRGTPGGEVGGMAADEGAGQMVHTMPGMADELPTDSPMPAHGAPAPSRHAPEHGPDCDHSMPASGCGVGVGCQVGVPGQAVSGVLQRGVPAPQYHAPTGGPVAGDVAPEPPPPRS